MLYLLMLFLMELLGSEKFRVREWSNSAILSLNARKNIAPFLEMGLSHPDLEVRHRCRRLLAACGTRELNEDFLSSVKGKSWKLTHPRTFAASSLLTLKRNGTGVWKTGKTDDVTWKLEGNTLFVLEDRRRIPESFKIVLLDTSGVQSMKALMGDAEEEVKLTRVD